jgi:uncharacterized protein
MSWEQAADEGTKPVLVCPLCHGTEFDQEEGRMDSRWGLTSHKLVLKICQRCGWYSSSRRAAASSTSTEASQTGGRHYAKNRGTCARSASRSASGGG